jgi:hypothetical protein
MRNTLPKSFIEAYKKVQKMMARNQGSRMQNVSKLGHSEDGKEKDSGKST